MKAALLIAVPAGAFLTAILWYLSQRLSSDALAMMIGMTLGVLSLVPTLVLVKVSQRRDDEDDWRPTTIDYPSQPVFSDEVTPYTHLLRRATGMPQLPDRQAEIDALRSALAYLESEVNR